MHRRTFLAAAAVSAAARAGAAAPAKTAERLPVVFTGDGDPPSPAEYGRLLTKLAEDGKAKPDSYSDGGVVAELEKQMAALLGKERAVFLPTGTMANHVAVRLLAGERRRVLVQRESHLYNDEGDGAQMLSGLSLVPLAPDRATFALEEVEAEIRRFALGPTPLPVGAISIESPVRRKSGEVFDFVEMQKIAAFARDHRIGLHLDGARVFLASAYTGLSPSRYAALFDTVYVSLYKYLNAAAGAILAGPRGLLENLSLIRRGFGGGLPHAWPYAAVALHYMDGFGERFQKAVASSEELLRKLAADPRFRVERIPSGTNIVALHVQTGSIDAFQKRLAAAGVVVRAPADKSNRILLNINVTINRRPPDEIARCFVEALG